MSLKINLDQVRFLRAKAQWLMDIDFNEQPNQIVHAVVGVQAQELPSAYLSIRARSSGVTESHIQRLHLDQAALAWTWCMRGTLHLITAEDARWLIPLLGPRNNASGYRRLRQLGWTDDTARKGIHLLLDLIHERGEVTRADAIEMFHQHGLPYEGQAPVHLLSKAVGEGLITTAGFQGTKPTYTLFEKRHGDLAHVQPEQGMAELARRYLSGYGPAGVKDFSNWSGLKMNEANLAWVQISSELTNVEVDGRTIQILAKDYELLDLYPGHDPVLRLLPRFDTYLLGYADRTWTVDPGFESHLFPGGGIISATIVLDGLVAGVWKLIPGKKRVTIKAEIFSDQSTGLFPLIEKEALDVGRFLAKEVDIQVSRQG